MKMHIDVHFHNLSSASGEGHNFSLQLGDAELEAFDGLTDTKGVVTKELFCQFAKVG